MQVERRYADCRFSPDDVSAAVREFRLLCESQPFTFEYYAVTLDGDESVRVDDLDHFLLVSNGRYESFCMRVKKGEHSLDINVSPRDSVVTLTAPTRHEMKGVFSIFDERREALAIKFVEEISPRYPTATRREVVRSCKASVDLIRELEKLLLERIPACMGLSAKGVEAGLFFLILDDGAERFASVNDYGRSRFRDSVRGMALRVDVSEGGRHCSAEVDFGLGAKIEVTVRCPAAREAATSLANECKLRVSEDATGNHYWRAIAFVALFAGLIATVMGFLYLPSRYFGHGLMLIAMGGASIGMGYLVNVCKPRTAFDTAPQATRDDRFKWFFRALCAFLLLTVLLNTVFVGIRRQVLGW